MTFTDQATKRQFKEGREYIRNMSLVWNGVIVVLDWLIVGFLQQKLFPLDMHSDGVRCSSLVYPRVDKAPTEKWILETSLLVLDLKPSHNLLCNQQRLIFRAFNF